MHQTSVSQLALPASSAEALNDDCHSAIVDHAALQSAMQAQGAAWQGLVAERCPHLFANATVLATAAQMRQMRDVVDAVERTVALREWDVSLLQDPLVNPLPPAGEAANVKSNFQPLGVFYGYDFHLNSDGAHLIEINTNAGGGFLNALLIDSQREAGLPGTEAAEENLDHVFLDMFLNEWRLARGNAPLQTVAIVDEQPESQYLYPEFLLAQRMFERAGIAAHIADPAAFQAGSGGLYLDNQKIDLVYNRLTDFSLQQQPALRQAYLDGSAVVTPSPAHYARYADKRNLARLTNTNELRTLGASEADIATLQAGIPHTIIVKVEMEETLWQDRKQWFFKPNRGYGSKGAYRGEKLTKRVFAEILQGDYVAQRLAPPGERSVCVNGAEPGSLKYDVRCYVYDRRVQLVAARLYQGQTTNFRTPGGGFAPVRVIE
jgi:hypothetical protein